MKVALVAPSAQPFVVGGAEKLWWGLLEHVNRHTNHEMELIKLPSPERDFWEVVRSYQQFARLDLTHFDAVISTKYPAWMVDHPNHVLYLQHKLRGLYDTYPRHLPLTPHRVPVRLQSLLRLCTDPRHERGQLADLFGRLDDARYGATAPDLASDEYDWFCFPGPLARLVVHKLDAIALRPGAIKRYLAISQTVSRRKDYFPPGVEIEVVPHPSNLKGLHEGPCEFVFTASRLDPAKRLDLLIHAYRKSTTDTPLVIAGDGPHGKHLREIAADDARIRFAGRLSDEDLADHYSRATMVPFLPQDEDMGLVTLEAMGCGKPVLTTTDSGGVGEFVVSGVNGCIVAPEPDALASAIDQMLASPATLRDMGQAALATAREVTWSRTAGALLASAQPARETGAPNGQRPRLLVLNTFGAYPPDSGGKKRLYHLYKGLSRGYDVTLLTLGPDMTASEAYELGPHLREIRVGQGEKFARLDAALSRKLRRPVTDITAMLFWESLTEFRAAFSRLSEESDIVGVSHPYLWPLVAQHWNGPVWYDAHNVEADMKADILGVPRLQQVPPPYHPGRVPNDATSVVARVAQVEGNAVIRSTRVLAVSPVDCQRLAHLYGRDPDSIELAANGTIVDHRSCLDGNQRAMIKAQLGWTPRMPVALFVGSFHGPNLAALELIHGLARNLPAWRFVVAGSVCEHVRAMPPRPSNLLPVGRVTEAELQLLLRSCDVGLNPMQSGSGTNMKVLDYASHGALVLTTAEGARGLALDAQWHMVQCELASFGDVLAELAISVPGPRYDVRLAAYEVVRRLYAWDAIASAVLSRR